ncbi:MAG TPA: hypothetical protein VGF77_05065 [Allosphingosinicella sp.]|jgi:hypothetical protein
MVDGQSGSGAQAEKEAGGMEGGMASGSAGGPSQAKQKAVPEKSPSPVEQKTPSPNVEDKIGDLGKGSHEQTQGGKGAGGTA